MSELVFVYGTLRKGQRANHYLETAQFLDEGRIEGFDLYDLGAYPGVQKSNCATVQGTLCLHAVEGEVYEIESEWLPILDRYEGCYNNDPGASLYVRVKTPVFLNNRQATVEDAWVYVYNNRVDKAQLIHSGDWLKR